MIESQQNQCLPNRIPSNDSAEMVLSSRMLTQISIATVKTVTTETLAIALCKKYTDHLSIHIFKAKKTFKQSFVIQNTSYSLGFPATWLGT